MNSTPPTSAEDPDGASAVHLTLACAQFQVLQEQVREAQRCDPENARIIARWRRVRYEGPQIPGDVFFRDNYTAEDDGYFYLRRDGGLLLVVATNLQLRVLHYHHDDPLAGHPGAEEPTRALQTHFHWPAVEQDVRRYVSGCQLCAVTKRGPHQPNAPLRPRQPERPWATVGFDDMSPYPATRDGNRFILVATDLYSRWVEATATASSAAPNIFALLDGVLARFGHPENLLTDNGTQFDSVS